MKAVPVLPDSSSSFPAPSSSSSATTMPPDPLLSSFASHCQSHFHTAVSPGSSHSNASASRSVVEVFIRLESLHSSDSPSPPTSLQILLDIPPSHVPAITLCGLLSPALLDGPAASKDSAQNLLSQYRSVLNSSRRAFHSSVSSRRALLLDDLLATSRSSGPRPPPSSGPTASSLSAAASDLSASTGARHKPLLGGLRDLLVRQLRSRDVLVWRLAKVALSEALVIEASDPCPPLPGGEAGGEEEARKAPCAVASLLRLLRVSTTDHDVEEGGEGAGGGGETVDLCATAGMSDRHLRAVLNELPGEAELDCLKTGKVVLKEPGEARTNIGGRLDADWAWYLSVRELLWEYLGI